MGSLLYVMRRSFINYLKSLKKKPLKALGPVFMIIFVILFLIPGKSGKGTPEPYMEVVFVTGFTLFVISSLLYSIHKGTKKLKSYFLMSDVNFIFPSPIRPQTVLIYGLVKQIAMEILISFWFIYQIPNILRSFNVSTGNQIMLIFAFVIFQIVLCSCLKLMIFALCSKYKGLAGVLRWAVRLAAILLAVVPAAFIYLNRERLEVVESAAKKLYYSEVISYIPVIGWMKEIAAQSIGIIGGSFYIYIALLIGLAGIMVYITYGIEIDYYEDILSMAEDNELVKKMKYGNVKPGDTDYNEYTRKKSVRIFVSPLRKVRLKLEGVYGAKTLFYKHINEHFKRGVWFINLYSLFLVIVSIIYALTPVREIKFLLFGFGILLAYSSLGNKIQNEIATHYIYMIPDEPENKLFYGSISSLIKVGIDGALLFVPSGIIMRSSSLEILLCVVTYLSIGVLCTFSGLFVYKIGGKIGLLASPILFSMFMLLFQSLMLVPNIIAVIVITMSLGDFGSYAVYLAMLFVNIAGSVGFIYACRSILDNMEQNSLY